VSATFSVHKNMPDKPSASLDEQTTAPKMLVVDDSATIRAGIARALPEETQIVEATNGEQAWEILQQDKEIELVITDLDMPKQNGFELIKCIRNSGVSRITNIPVIVVTGAEDTNAKYRAFVEGANDFISKNTDKVELMARVRAHKKLAQTIRELEDSKRSLKHQADTDSLTKLTNRRSFFSRASKDLATTRLHEDYFSVLMIDIDHFKAINDTYGHQAGDYVLVEVAKILSHNVRNNDTLARIGGEEFAIALPYSTRLASVVMAERLRKAIQTAKFEFAGNIIPVTISLGLATVDCGVECEIEHLMAIADKRLYIAKRKGRNRLCASDSEDDLTDPENEIPKLDEALTMLDHGNDRDLAEHLHTLIRQTLPLFKLGNEYYKNCFDIDLIEAGAKALEDRLNLSQQTASEEREESVTDEV
jgi:two-component system cell cycle response regulator